jgi:hypothetical protein
LNLSPQCRHFGFQLRDPREQCTDNQLRLWRLTSDDFFRDKWFHAHSCALKPQIESRPFFTKNSLPPRERLRTRDYIVARLAPRPRPKPSPHLPALTRSLFGHRTIKSFISYSIMR